MKAWIDLNLRSIGQVMFQDHPLTGFCFLIGIFWAAYTGASMPLALGALIGVIAANAFAPLLKVKNQNLQKGLYGYNGVLVGLAIMVFFKSTPVTWILLVTGSIASTALTWVMIEKSKMLSRIPALTFPFVFVTWLIYFAVLKLAPDLINASSAPAPNTNAGFELYCGGIFKSVSEVFLLDSPLTGGLFILGLSVSSIAASGFAIFGTALALIITVLTTNEPHRIEAGLFGYNAVLTAIALGSVFLKPSFTSVIITSLGVGITMLIQCALGFGLAKLGLPSLTAPFIFATWIVLAGKGLAADKLRLK